MCTYLTLQRYGLKLKSWLVYICSMSIQHDFQIYSANCPLTISNLGKCLRMIAYLSKPSIVERRGNKSPSSADFIPITATLVSPRIDDEGTVKAPFFGSSSHLVIKPVVFIHSNNLIKSTEECGMAQVQRGYLSFAITSFSLYSRITVYLICSKNVLVVVVLNLFRILAPKMIFSKSTPALSTRKAYTSSDILLVYHPKFQLNTISTYL